MAHIHEKIDFTTSVYVVYEDKVLLHLHKKAGIWLPPGGHIELDEDPTDAARREVKEEAGIDVDLIGQPLSGHVATDRGREILPPKYIFRHFYDDTKQHEHVDLIYFAKVMDAAFVSEDGVEMRWISKQEIEAGSLPLNEDVRIYSLAAIKELS